MWLCPETEVVGAEVGRSTPRGQIDLGMVYRRRNGRNHALGYLVLERKDVVQLALKPIRPEVRARRGIDQLAGDAKCSCCLAHATFNHVANAKFTSHLFDID